MISKWKRLKEGNVIGIVDSYGVVHSVFTGEDIGFHEVHFSQNSHCKWRWNNDKSIWWISPECKPSEEEYESIMSHMTKKYGLTWRENGHHDIDHLNELCKKELNINN